MRIRTGGHGTVRGMFDWVGGADHDCGGDGRRERIGPAQRPTPLMQHLNLVAASGLAELRDAV